MENNEKQEPIERLKVATDWGKLRLAGKDIYDYQAGEIRIIIQLNKIIQIDYKRILMQSLYIMK